MGTTRWDRSPRERLNIFKRRCIRGGRNNISCGTDRRLCDGFFREHNQEADLANLGNEGQKKITIEEEKNAEGWKAIHGYWMIAKKKKTAGMDVGL